MALEWKEPPQAHAFKRTDYRSVVDELAGRPGDWALLETFPTRSKATNYLRQFRATAGHRIEAITRMEDSQFNVYARVLPNG